MEVISGDEFRRKQQQGEGKPIIHTDFRGKKIVAIGSRVVGGDWITFHDFLMDFFKKILEQAWGQKAFSGATKNLHPMITFYRKLRKKLGEKSNIKSFKDSSGIVSAKCNGESRCFLNFAYSLYIISHNSELSKKFLKRLQYNDQFWGAYYEAYITCILIRAGFEIAFEDESDSSKSHGELIATDPKTGNRYWVEAKFKLSDELLGKKQKSEEVNFQPIRTKIYKALKKETNLERIVFIEVCKPNLPKIDDDPFWYPELKKLVQNLELEDIDGKPAPEAILVFTSQDLFCGLSNLTYNTYVYSEGFKKGGYGSDVCPATWDEALALRNKYQYVKRIMDSFKNFEIPATFDGQIPEFAFNPELNKQRLIIGNQYLVPTDEGKEVVGTLRQALVIPGKENSCTCVFDIDGSSSICNIPLSDEEMIAYNSYPDTFFGEYEKVDHNATSPFDLYDMMCKSYKNTSKEKLLEFMNASDDTELSQKSQQELLEMYARGMATSMWNTAHKN